MTRLVEGDVVELRCQGCHLAASTVIFSGDTDMTTFGLVSLTSLTGPDVVVAEAIQSELAGDHDACGMAVQRRVSHALHRSDLRFVPLVRVQDDPPAPHTNFREFKASYELPRLFYACPHCRAGEAAVIRTQSFDEFERNGGKVTVLGDLKVVI